MSMIRIIREEKLMILFAAASEGIEILKWRVVTNGFEEAICRGHVTARFTK